MDTKCHAQFGLGLGFGIASGPHWQDFGDYGGDHWIYVKFSEPISVNPNLKYYIVYKVKHPNTDFDGCIHFGRVNEDIYPGGEISDSVDNGKNWRDPRYYTDFAFVLLASKDDNMPNPPDNPTGKTNGKKGETYTYTTKTTDPQGDKVQYGWD